jgi:hypothetical protein
LIAHANMVLYKPRLCTPTFRGLTLSFYHHSPVLDHRDQTIAGAGVQRYATERKYLLRPPPYCLHIIKMDGNKTSDRTGSHSPEVGPAVGSWAATPASSIHSIHITARQSICQPRHRTRHRPISSVLTPVGDGVGKWVLAFWPGHRCLPPSPSPPPWRAIYIDASDTPTGWCDVWLVDV